MLDIKEEKLWLIDQIVQLQDAQLLSNIKELLQTNVTVSETKSVDFWQELSVSQQHRIERSIMQLDSGRGISHSSVMRDFRQKYNR